jgi:alkylation response protein AidB-like acyl-CoA dehydrogenase
MNFGFSEEQELLRKTARDFLADNASMPVVREIMEGPLPGSKPLWSALAELGWTGLAFPESYGGAGLGMVELCIVLEELGRTLAPVPFLSTAMAGRAILETGSDSQRKTWLTRICAGEATASLALAEEHGSDAPADLHLSARRQGDGWVLTGRKLFVPDGECADLLLVVARLASDGEGTVDGENGMADGESRLGLFLVPGDTAGVTRRSMSGMDLLRPVAEIELDAVALPADALLGGNEEVWPVLGSVLDRGRVMICAEMLGGAEKCLEDSVAYAKERVQFGKPIGVHQAIKHKCADMLFEVESARSITYYAAWAAGEENDEAPLMASMAKAYVSDAYRMCSAENVQIHGGVGFTWEFDCHLYFKRSKSDACWLGDATAHRERVARLMEIQAASGVSG